jgi:dienelactone hydrolase
MKLLVRRSLPDFATRFCMPVDSKSCSAVRRRNWFKRGIRPCFVSLVFWLWALAPALFAADESLQVLDASGEAGAAAAGLESWLNREFGALVDRRSVAFEKMIKSEAACRVWQKERRDFFLKQIGGLPERTPLNPQIVGTLQGRGYRVEKIILETRPGFHLTANLYLPETPPPWPGVLVACGHSHDGKAVGQYQLASRLLARNGMAAICYDPIGQGERYQILDSKGAHTAFEDAPHIPTPHPRARFLCITEHTTVGISSALLGANVAQYRIWDGMRVIDYLQSRPDILPDKIGCTGNSGGGTETAYLMALDDRILVAAPGCYLTTFRKLIETRGPQDGEQNIFGQIAFGMDEADYCIMRAPKPTLIAAGVRDATFSFAGTAEVFIEAKRFYSRLGHPENLDLAAPDAPHGFTLPLREAVTRFMARWLLGRDQEVREVGSLPDTLRDDELLGLSSPDWTAEQLQCTPGGQVLMLPGEKSVFEINAAEAASLRASRSAVWNALDSEGRRRLVRETIGAEDFPEVRVETLGTFPQGETTVHRLAMTVAPGVRIPALGFVPRQSSGAATLYLHGSSMSADAGPVGPIQDLLRRGHVVLSAEVRGVGETETGRSKRAFGAGRFGPDTLEVLTAYLMGRSYVGMRTEDALGWLRFLRSHSWGGAKLSEWHAVGVGEAAIPALHAAALAGDVFTSVRLERSVRSWEDIARSSETHDQLVNMVHGVLRHYDLPELVALVGRERVKVLHPVDACNRPLP